MMLGRTWISWRRAALVMVLGASLAACGDDDDGRRPLPDAGNGGLDAGGDDTDGGGGGDTDAGGSPDGGGGTRVCMPAGGMCDVMLQNCPNATDGCYFGRASGGTDTTLCAPAGTAAEGATCENLNDCLPGLACSGGVCRTYCCDGLTSDCPSGTGQTCLGLSGAGNIGTCTAAVACTLVPNGGCPASQGCYPFGDDGTLGCFGAGDLVEGANCGGMGLNSCAPGSGCLSVDGTNFSCIRFCRIDQGEGDCSAGRACQAVSGLALPANTGICPPASGS